MKKLAGLLIVFTIGLISCTEDSILPTTGNVLFIDAQNEYNNESYSIVSEIFYLTTDSPFWIQPDDALVTGTITNGEISIKDLNSGNYYLVIPLQRKSKLFQVKAGKTIEYQL